MPQISRRLDRLYRLLPIRRNQDRTPGTGALFASSVDFVNVQASGDLAVGLADQIKTLEKKTAALEHDVSALKAQLATLQAVALRNPRLGPPVHRLRAADHRELAAVIAAILAEVE